MRLFLTAIAAGLVALVSGVAVAQPTPAKKDAPAPSVYGMTKAFNAANKFVPVKDWKGNNDLQREFLQDFIGLGKEADKLPKSMLDAIASHDVNVVNKFLKDNGLTMQLQPFGQDGFGAAAVLSVEGKWAGQKLKITGDDGNKYDGVLLRDVEFFKVPGQLDPVTRIYTSKEFNVYVTPWDGDDSGFNAVKVAGEFTPTKTTKTHSGNYEQITLPMVDMDRTSKLDWLVGMKSNNGYKVQEALAQTILKLDENGFKVKEGFAFSATRSIPKVYQLKKAFLLWVEVPGLSYPVFAVKVDTQYWKNPNTAVGK